MRRPLLVVLALVLAGGLTACQGDADEPVDVGGNGGAGSASGGTYVALGDSYTAAPFVPTTDTSDGCLQSDGNYPHLVAARMDDLDLTDVSCGGASTENMTAPQQTTSGEEPPQLDALDAGTSVVTLGIGGNDYSTFATLITSCLQIAASDPTGAPCTEAAEQQGDSLDDTGTRIQGNIEDVVAGIDERAPDARVLLVGYPDVVPRSGSCDQLPLATGDYTFARDVIDMLNDAVEGAAEATGADYVDVHAATQGHDICAADPWVAGAQPVSGQAAPFHPYAAEQEVVADLVVEALRG